MDFYVIPPLSNLELMHEGKGKRYFCLAQLYKKHAHYREFFQQQIAQGNWVTLDNGAGDHDIVTVKDLVDITLSLQPSEVIPPDILFDGITTIRNLERFIYTVDELMTQSYEASYRIQYLGCPQGRNEQEWLLVYEYMLTHPAVTTIGLSKIAVPKAFINAEGDRLIAEGRNICYDQLKEAGLLQKPLHLLGMGDPTEMLHYKNDPLIRSTDSCNTVWSAMNGLHWWRKEYQRIPTPKDYFDRTMTVEQVQIAKDNIGNFKRIVC